MDDNIKFKLFMSFSRVITGYEELNDIIGKDYIARILQRFSDQLVVDILITFESILETGVDVTKLIGSEIINNHARGSLSREIIMLWYTGQFMDENGEIDTGDVSHYFDGLMWKVIQAHPPGMAGGAYGYWAQAPEVQ